MSNVGVLLKRLHGVRKTPRGWNARCPAHDDRDPSLSVSVGDNGAVLVHCFSGCPAGDVLAAVGLQFSDLYPDHCHHAPPGRRPLPSLRRIGKALAIEIGVLEGALRDPATHDHEQPRIDAAIRRIRAISEELST